MTKEQAYNTISELVERANEQLASYKKPTITKHSQDVILSIPFFKALGWDMDNSNGYAEAYREVIHEDKLKIKTTNHHSR